MYHELTMTSKEYMQCVTAVEPLWLAEQGPMFFQAVDASSRLNSKRLDKEDTKSMERELQEAEEQRRAMEEKERASKMVSKSRIAMPGAPPAKKAAAGPPRRRIGM